MKTASPNKPNRYNRYVFIGDNREVMLGLNAEIADAIITDPPFNSGQTLEDAQRKSVRKTGRRDYPVDEHGNPTRGFDDKWSIKDLKRAEIDFLKYKDTDLLEFTDFVGRTHSTGMEAYLMMMASRLLLCRELLKETGSIFLHCDHSSNNYLRTLMDMIFGRENFRNEIVWWYNKWTNTCQHFQRNHDTILWYAKNVKQMKFNKLFGGHSKRQKEIRELGYHACKGRLVVYDPVKAEKRIQRAKKEGWKIDHIQHELPGLPLPDVWELSALNGQAKERSGKATQKPVALYSRLVLASTDEGDLVLDPFCGCATTLVAAENAGRQWIGIDLNPTTEELVIEQLTKLSEGTEDFWRKKAKIRHNLPKRTDNRLSKKELRDRKDKLMVNQLKQRPYLVCVVCGTPKDEFDLQVGHKHPKVGGGGWELENLQLECGRCNGRKSSTKTTEQVRAELRREGLLYKQRLEVHAYMKTLTQQQKDWQKGIKQRKKPRWKEDLERKKASRQPEMGLI